MYHSHMLMYRVIIMNAQQQNTYMCALLSPTSGIAPRDFTTWPMTYTTDR